jgi:DNA-binding CsgD family transcriptional regulator
MRPGVAKLTEREREVLRLLARGHDTKSSAQALGITIHSVNERLRDARQKLGVSSSREAARILSAHAGAGAEDIFLGDEKTGLGNEYEFPADVTRPRDPSEGGSGRNWQIAPRGPAAPRVVATAPAKGSVIRPGSFVLSVTFDRPMREGSYSFIQVSAETYPSCDGRPTLSADRRTYSLRCSARPGGRYEIWFNREPFMNFKSKEGVAAVPYQLRFTTRP